MDHDFPDPARAQKALGVSSIVMGVLGLTAVVIPSLFAISTGRVSRDLYARGHRGTDRDLGKLGVRFGYVGLGLAAVGATVFALATILSA